VPPYKRRSLRFVTNAPFSRRTRHLVCDSTHMNQMASIDFFLVPTATFRLLFVFVVWSHARRRVLLFQVTHHPSQERTMLLMREAFPWDHACRYLLNIWDARGAHREKRSEAKLKR